MKKANKFNFTEDRLGKIKAGSSKKRYYDKKTSGLCLIVHPTGKKVFAVYKKIADKVKTKIIGNYPETTIESARKKTLIILVQYMKGEDPVKNDKCKWTLERWLTAYLKDKKLKSRTATQYQDALKNYSPKFFNQPLTNITNDAVLTVYKNIENGDLSWRKKNGEIYEMRKGSPSQASLWARVLRAVYSYAIGETENNSNISVLPKNPVLALNRKKAWADVPRKKTRIRDRHLSMWFEAIDSLLVDCLVARLESRAAFCDRLLFYFFSGLRSVEAQNLTWKRVRLHDRYFWIEETKNGEAIELPLTDSLMNILIRRKSLCGDNPYVFGVEGRDNPVKDIRKTISSVLDILKELESQRAKKIGSIPNSDVYKNVSPQDIRRTYASIVFTQFYSPYIIKRLLNHTVEDKRDVTVGYLSASADELRSIANKVENFILNESSVSDNDFFPSELENGLKM